MRHRHIDQRHPCYGLEEDVDPEEPPTRFAKCPNPEDGGNAVDKDTEDCQAKQPARKRRNPLPPSGDQYGPHSPRPLEWL